MTRRLILLAAISALLAASLPGQERPEAAPLIPDKRWRVEKPIVHSNLALFPVVAARVHSSRAYVTLDEGLRAGEIEVAELGALWRRRPGAPAGDSGRAEVNKLALVNHSKRALIVLAGEIVTGGKQDRVIAKDRVIPPGVELPLDVFCVEPGRWHGASASFVNERAVGLMAAPNVREKAAVAKNQQEVWDATAETREANAARAAAGGVAGDLPINAREHLAVSSSYAQLEAAEPLKAQIDAASGALQRDYEQALRELPRGERFVGVVVALNGEVIWADLFADGDLFERYWPKLLRSYVVEALAAPVVEHARAAVEDAERFLAEQRGREIIEREPGEYRLLQIDNPRYAVFELTSLWEKTEPMMHFSKLRKETREIWKPIRPLLRQR